MKDERDITEADKRMLSWILKVPWLEVEMDHI